MTDSTAQLRMGTPAGRWVLLATISGSGLAMLDVTIVTVALARLGQELDAGFSDLQWVLNAYTLTLAALILLGGALGDRFGRRRVFVVGIAWFALASLLCAVAPAVELLVAARALQGIGGALLTPGSLAIISASFAAGDRARAIGAWSGLTGLAGAAGPFLGGWLVALDWRAVFLVNLPVALVVATVTLRHVPETRDDRSPPGLDVPGTLLVTAGLGALTYALTAAGEGGAGATVLLTAGAAVAALVGFVLVQRRSPHPLVRLQLFASRRFSVANGVTLLVYSALGVFFFLLVLQLQTVSGFSPLVAGTALLPVTALMLLLSSRAGALSERIGPRIPMTIGPLVAAAGFLLTLRIGPGASYPLDVLPATVVLGLGLSLTVAPLTATVLGSAEQRYAGTASGVNNAIARSAQLLAVAVIPVAAGISGDDYTVPAAFDAGFDIAMTISAVLLLCGATLSGLLLGEPARLRPEPVRIGELPLPRCAHCGVAGPQLYPEERAPAQR